MENRLALVNYLQSLCDIKNMNGSLLDYNIDIKTADWTPWQESVPSVEVDPKDIGPNILVPTVDTARHVDVLRMCTVLVLLTSRRVVARTQTLHSLRTTGLRKDAYIDNYLAFPAAIQHPRIELLKCDSTFSRAQIPQSPLRIR